MFAPLKKGATAPYQIASKFFKLDILVEKSLVFGANKIRIEFSAVRKVHGTILFHALGSFETLGSKLSHGTSTKFADVRTHLRKISI